MGSSEREFTRDADFQDVTKSWVGNQSIVGPWIYLDRGDDITFNNS